MHRQFERAYYYKSLSQDDADNVTDEDNPAQAPSLCQRIRRQLPDSESDKFALFIGIVIVANAIILGLETDLGQEHFLSFEHVFGIIFTGEMTLRLAQIGCLEYFSKGSNMFDCLLVCTGDFDLWVSPFLQSDHAGKSPSSTAKFMKLLRMFRVMRIVRLFKMFHELQIILEAFVKALHTVMWVGLLTVILNYICAVFLTQTIGHNAETWGPEHEADILQWFGSIGHSMRTLFIIITLAQWDEIALVVSQHVNGFVVFTMAIAYITLTAFTMVSLITGIISEELVGAQRDDEVHKLEMIEKGKFELAENVKSVLHDFDDDASGSLSEEEVKQAFGNTDLKLFERLQALDISMDMDEFLALISKLKEANQTDEIPIDDIAQALKHLSGTATASSIWDLKMLLLQIQKEHSQANSLVETIGEKMDAFSSDLQNGRLAQSTPMDDVMNRLASFEQRCQSENARLEDKLGSLQDVADRLEGKLNNLKSCKTDDKVLDRLMKLEEVMHVLCNHLVNGNGASTDAAGTGESCSAEAPRTAPLDHLNYC